MEAFPLAGTGPSKTQVFAEAVGVGVGTGVKSDVEKINKGVIYLLTRRIDEG